MGGSLPGSRRNTYARSAGTYVYDPARGEPHREITAGTSFNDLTEEYVCPVCAMDTRLTTFYGKVTKASFKPIEID